MAKEPTLISPGDDPNSELNTLRREVRHLQASVRDAGLQIASQQDELIELRKSLSAAEMEIEEVLTRESNLRTKLHVQSMKKEQVESTMVAAEALIESLRDMVRENSEAEGTVVGNSLSAGGGGFPQSGWNLNTDPASLDEMGSKLDRVLEKIGEPEGGEISKGNEPVGRRKTGVVEDGESSMESSGMLERGPGVHGVHMGVVLGDGGMIDGRGVVGRGVLVEGGTVMKEGEVIGSEGAPGESKTDEVMKVVQEATPEIELLSRENTIQSQHISTVPIEELDKGPEYDVNSSSSLPVTNPLPEVINTTPQGKLSPWLTCARSLSEGTSRAPAPGQTASQSLASVTPQSAAPVQKPTLNLLLSAFRLGSTIGNHPTPAIRTAGVEPGDTLPSEVASIAKAEGAPREAPLAFPSIIATTVNDAHNGEIYALAASSDGAWTVSGGDDKLVKVYDRGGTPYATISENARVVTALSIEPAFDGEDVVIYAGGSDGSVRAFRRNERRKTRWNMASVVPVHSQAVRKIVATGKLGKSGNMGMVLTCSTDRTIRMYDIEQGRRAFSITGPSAVFDISTFEGNQQGLIVSGHKDGGLRLWSGRDGNGLVGGAKVHSKGVVSVSCLADGNGVVSLGRDNVIRISDIRMNVAIVREMEKGVHSVSDWHRIATNGRHVACGSGKYGLCIWNVDTGKVVRRVSTQVSDPDADVLDMVARKLRSPGCVTVPLWSPYGHFVCGHRTRQVSFWS